MSCPDVNSQSQVGLFPSNAKNKILECRRVLRWHRDQIGDDRCWLNDLKLYEVARVRHAFLNADPLIPFRNFIRFCEDFHDFCNSEQPLVIPNDAVLDPQHWDDDLEGKSNLELYDELEKLRSGILEYAQITNRPKTVADNQKLYNLLPEKLPADFRLPPKSKFLDNDDPRKGCTNFWFSHADCSRRPCNLSQWGPCK